MVWERPQPCIPCTRMVSLCLCIPPLLLSMANPSSGLPGLSWDHLGSFLETLFTLPIFSPFLLAFKLSSEAYSGQPKARCSAPAAPELPSSRGASPPAGHSLQRMAKAAVEASIACSLEHQIQWCFLARIFWKNLPKT